MASTRGRQVVVPWTNKSGAGVALGDVVILDTANDTAFTTTTTGRSETTIGIAQETIANNATGRVLIAGEASIVNVPASVTRGHYIETHTIAKQAVGSSTRRSGSFGQFKTGGTTPSAVIWLGTDQTASAASGMTYASWTPTLTADSGDPNLGSTGAATGRYAQSGKFTHAYGRVAFGGSGVSAGNGEYEFLLPAAAASGAVPPNTSVYGTAVLYDDSAATFQMAAVYALDANECRIAMHKVGAPLTVAQNAPWTWAANDVIVLNLTYEAA